MAAPTIGNVQITTGGGTTVTKPTGDAAGDFFLIWVHSEDFASTPTTPAITGFTLLTGSGGHPNTQGVWGGWYYRVRDGSEGANFTVSGGGLGTFTVMIATLISGADTAQTPLNGTLLQQADGVSATPSCPGVTTTVADTLCMIGFGAWEGDSTGPAATGWSSAALDATDGNSIAILSKAFNATGATGSVTVTYNGDSGGGGSSLVMQMVGFAPTGGGGGNDPDVPLLNQTHTFNVHRM